MNKYTAFDTKPARCWGNRGAQTSVEFVAFLVDIVVNQPATQEIRVIADTLSAHKTKQVTEFLRRRPTVHLHFAPTYSSWLKPGRALVRQDRA